MSGRTDAAVASIARKLIPVNRGQEALERARMVIEKRIVHLSPDETSLIAPDILWDYGPDRARGRRAHGFTFLSDWLGASQGLSREDAKSIALLVYELARTWDKKFGQRRDSALEMAFHDETTAQRLLGIVGALDFLEFEPDQHKFLLGFANRTAELVSDPRAYAGLNNHGMFQNLSLLAWSVLAAPADDALGAYAWDLAIERLYAYFSMCFTTEGVHIENTPTYHLMVARYLPILKDLFTCAGVAEAELYSSLIPGAVAYAVHCVTPEGVYPPVSDTHRRRIDSPQNLNTFKDDEFEYAATAGARGQIPRSRTIAFPVSGYAMTRSAWGDPKATFVHFTCAYNADYHKHSDEQSVYLRSNGRNLLCEAGPYGYNWRDKYTKYAYSSSAHNSLLVGGEGLPRTEEASAARPYLNCLKVACAEDNLLDATGITLRYSGRIWERHLRVVHGLLPSDSRLFISDMVRSAAGAERFEFLWHLGPGLRVVLQPEGVEVFDETTKVLEIQFRSETKFTLRVLEGQVEPSIQGWHFPEFGRRVPAPVLVVELNATNFHLSTEVRLSDFSMGSDRAGSEDLPSELRPPSPLVRLGSRGQRQITWEPKGAGTQSVLVVSGYSEAAHCRRFVAELAKTDHEVCHLVNVGDYIESTCGPPEADSESKIEEVSHIVADHIRSRATDGVEVTVATVGEGFGPGVLAALEMQTPIISLDPRWPRRWRENEVVRAVARMRGHLDERSAKTFELLLSREGEEDGRVSVRSLVNRARCYPETHGLLRADLEDAFPGIIVNALDVRADGAIKYIACYDRTSREFVVVMPDVDAIEAAVRVFKGKKQVASKPYTVGKCHRIAYSGVAGPYRLRIHIREGNSSQPTVFTSGILRVR